MSTETTIPKTSRENLEATVDNLSETVEKKRRRAAGWLAMTAFYGAGFIAGITSKTPYIPQEMGSAVAIAGSAAFAAYEGLHSVTVGQRAAALEGALAQQELAATPYTPDQPQHFEE